MGDVFGQMPTYIWVIGLIGALLCWGSEAGGRPK